MVRSAAKPRVSNHGPLAPPPALPILRDARLRRAPQRLSCLSSGLPFPFISEHGVEGCEDLAGDGDEGDHFRLTGDKQASVEGSEAWVVATGNESGNVESPPCGPPSATDLALALSVARLTGEGSNTHQACDLAQGDDTYTLHTCRARDGTRLIR